MTVQFRIEALAPEHDRAGFVCGSDALDRYLREQASQDIRRRTSACYVAIGTKSNAIAGYYPDTDDWRCPRSLRDASNIDEGAHHGHGEDCQTF